MRPSLTTLGIVIAFALLVASVPPTGAQDPEPEPEQPEETPDAGLTADLFMDNTPREATNTTVEFTEPLYSLVEGGGTATAVGSGCAGGAPGLRTLAYWISDPFSEHPVTFLGSVNVTVSFTAGENSPQPVSQGAVSIRLVFGMVTEAGTHEIAANEITVDPQAPAGGQALPAGVLPGSVDVPLQMDENHLAAAGAPLLMTLEAECGGAGDWNLQLGDVPAIAYVIGAPGDADTDADGIPDPYDDDIDGDGTTNSDEETVGSDPRDASVTPQSTSDTCPGFTYQEVYDETGSPSECPVTGGFPWLLLVLIVLVVVLLGGVGAGAFVVVNKKIKMTVSHDGFQALEKGQAAEYELTLMATGKKEEEIPVELTLKGVPEDWSASLEPSQMTLLSGEATEARTAVLRLTPPPEEAHEAEAQVTVTATPTDAEGKTSAMKPGTSVKTKTIVNIGVVPPEGEGKPKKAKKPKKDKAADDAAPAEEAGAAETAEAGSEEAPKKKGLGGLLKRKKKDDAEADESADAAPGDASAGASASPAAGGKPSVAMGKMVHDPADFSAGDEVTTTVAVRNKGDGPVAGLTLSLYVNDQRADQQSVDLDAGASEEVTFKWTAQPDENRVRLKGSMKGA